MDFSKLFKISGVTPGYELNASEHEIRFMNFLQDIIKNDSLVFKRNSQSYLSAYCGNNDFIRFKVSDKTKWFSIFLLGDLRKKYKDSSLFASQENKNLNHWKVKFNSFDDLDSYMGVIKEAWDMTLSYEL